MSEHKMITHMHNSSPTQNSAQTDARMITFSHPKAFSHERYELLLIALRLTMFGTTRQVSRALTLVRPFDEQDAHVVLDSSLRKTLNRFLIDQGLVERDSGSTLE